MNFDFSEDQKLLQQTARDALERQSPLSVCRDVLESDATYAKDVWKSAAELGWLGTAVPEEYGGAGFGYLELAVVAEEIGRSLAPIPFSSSVYLASEALLLAGSDAQKSAHLPRLVSGDAIGTLALTEAEGQNGTEAVETRFDNGVLTGSKLPVFDGEVADLAVVAARSDAGPCLALVELGAEGVVREPVPSIDPSRTLSRIRFEGAPAELLGSAGDGDALVSQVLDRAAVLMGFEQLGGAERSFEITKEFALGRYAFGRPIASFQAIKHRLADMWCEIELARSNCYYGAWALSSGASELPVAACLSRVSAADAFHLTTVEMVQLHGGVGYTWEYDCHLFYRRAKWLNAAIGTQPAWRERLMQQLEAAPTH